jgi:hypothetical protein
MNNLSGSTVEYSSEVTSFYDVSTIRQAESRGSQWYTREGDVRKQIFLMTKNHHNISRTYRELLRGMVASFNDVGYLTDDNKFVEVKCLVGSPERAIAKMFQEDNIILPIISVVQTITTNDDDRRKNESLLVHEKYFDPLKQRAIRILSLAPRAVNILYQVNIWSKYRSDLDQILEQVRLKFNPEMQIPTPFSTLCKGYIDSEQDIGAVEVADKEDRVLKKQINITVRTYIPNPKFMLTSTGKIEQFKIDTTL